MFEGLPTSFSLHTALKNALLAAAILILTVTPGVTASALPILGIDNSPAPPPELGPAASAHALRNKKYLPYEICGILGGYVVTVLILAALYWTVGRRRRLQALMAQGVIEVEMQQPHKSKLTDDGSLKSPGSPGSKRRWFFRQLSGSKDKTIQISEPTKDGVVTTTVTDTGLASPTESNSSDFDNDTLKKDRESRQKDMERLYAAVMEHDAKKSSPKPDQDQPTSSDESSSSGNNGAPRQKCARPAPIKTDASPPKKEAGTSPVSYRAIYPPGTTSPVSQRSQPQPPPTPSQKSPSKSGFPSPRGLVDRVSFRSSTSSSGSKTKRSLRNLRISAPMSQDEEGDEERTPLSPRSYNPPTPPEPPMKSELRNRSIDGRRVRAEEELNQPAPLPRPAPQRGASHPSNKDINVLTERDNKQRSAASSASTLPLRGMGNDSGEIKFQTTVLERRDPKLRQRTGGAPPMTPATGVPMTPYSPYMPYTPITPITPHLVTKKEMKAMKKEQKKKVLASDDVVKSEQDMWDSGW